MKKILSAIFIIQSLISFGQCFKLYVKEHYGGDPICILSNDSELEICEKKGTSCYRGGTIIGGKCTFYIQNVRMSGDVITYDFGIDECTPYFYAPKYGELIINTQTKNFGFKIDNDFGTYSYYNENEASKYREQQRINKEEKEKEKAENLLKQQEYEKNAKLKAEKIKNLIDAHNLNNYSKTIKQSTINEAIKGNVKFRKIIELADKDTILFEIINGSISKMNFNYSFDNYCQYLWDYQRTAEYRSLTNKEQDSIRSLSKEMCLGDKRSYLDYESFRIKDFFPKNTFQHDTIIENTRIPLNNFKIVIVKNKKLFFDATHIWAPKKYEGEKLYLFKEPFKTRLEWAGYFTNSNAQNFTEISVTEKVPIKYTNDVSRKDLVISGDLCNMTFVDNILIKKEKVGKRSDWYKFKKIK